MSRLTWLQKNILSSTRHRLLNIIHPDCTTPFDYRIQMRWQKSLWFWNQNTSTNIPQPVSQIHLSAGMQKSVVITTDKIFEWLFEQPAQFPFVNQNKRNNKSRNPQGIETRDYWRIKISVASAVWLSRPQAAQHRRRALLKTREISVCQSCSQPVIQASVLSSGTIKRIKRSIGRANSSQ